MKNAIIAAIFAAFSVVSFGQVFDWSPTFQCEQTGEAVVREYTVFPGPDTEVVFFDVDSAYTITTPAPTGNSAIMPKSMCLSQTLPAEFSESLWNVTVRGLGNNNVPIVVVFEEDVNEQLGVIDHVAYQPLGGQDHSCVLYSRTYNPESDWLVDGWCDSSPGSYPCPADVNQDGFIDQTDVDLLVTYYGSTEACHEITPSYIVCTDLDGDGVTGFSDIQLVLATINTPCYN